MDGVAHEDVDYYRGQYRLRLLSLLRELQAAEEDSVNSFICLLKKKKEVRLVEKVLAEKEEAFTERMKALAEQWRDLHARRAQLKAHVERSGRTVQENERLRSQALEKANRERGENAKREGELLRAKRELESLRKQHQKLSKKLLKYSMFKRYLEDVVENSQLRDIEELISFYKALVRTRKDLLQSQQWHQQLTEQAKVLLEQHRAEIEAEMLQCKDDLEQLKQCCDQARSDILYWEGRWAELRDTAARKATELRSIAMAIHSLFQAASTRLKARWKVAADDSHRQLDMIQQFIQDLRNLSEDTKKHRRIL